MFPFWKALIMQEAGDDGAGAGGGAPPPEAVDPGGDPAEQSEGAEQEPQEPTGFEAKYLKQAQLNKGLHRQVLKSNQQIKELNAKLEKLAGNDKLWDEDPVAALKARGIDYSELTKRILDGNNLTDEQREQAKIRQELDELKSERQKQQEAQQKAEEEKATREVLDQIQSQYEEAGEDYAFSAALGRRGAFLKALKDHLAETGEHASHEEQAEIASRIEKQTRDTVHTQVETLVKKSPSFRAELQRMLAATDEEAPSDEVEPDQQAEKVETRVKPAIKRTRSKTITRSHQSATGGRTQQKRETFEERKARIAAGG